jgi:23S rRNA pseudouridine1911/1915/1917 synthase
MQSLLQKIKIVFEDESFLVIDKPGGLVVHSDGRTEEESLVDWIKMQCNEGGGEAAARQEKIGNPHTLDSGRYFARWGIVNRLDRETSGIILIAKTPEVFENLQKQFINRTIAKEYSALVWGRVEEKFIKITEPISRHKKDPRIWVCGLTGEEGGRNTTRDAETDLEVESLGEKTTLVKLFPKTGRTHQLRLHTRFIGHPIVGDTKYGVNGITNEHSTKQINNLLENLNEADLEIDKKTRLMLHARSLEFLHPVTNEKIKLETELPTDFNL